MSKEIPHIKSLLNLGQSRGMEAAHEQRAAFSNAVEAPETTNKLPKTRKEPPPFHEPGAACKLEAPQMPQKFHLFKSMDFGVNRSIPLYSFQFLEKIGNDYNSSCIYYIHLGTLEFHRIILDCSLYLEKQFKSK